MAVVRARRDDLDLFSMRVINHPQCANGSRMRSRRLEPRKASPHAMPLASIEHHHNIAHRRMPPVLRKGSVCGLRLVLAQELQTLPRDAVLPASPGAAAIPTSITTVDVLTAQ